MTSLEIIEELKHDGCSDKSLETLDLMTLTVLLGTEHEQLSFKVRQDIGDLHFLLKRLFEEVKNSG